MEREPIKIDAQFKLWSDPHDPPLADIQALQEKMKEYAEEEPPRPSPPPTRTMPADPFKQVPWIMRDCCKPTGDFGVIPMRDDFEVFSFGDQITARMSAKYLDPAVFAEIPVLEEQHQSIAGRFLQRFGSFGRHPLTLPNGPYDQAPVEVIAGLRMRPDHLLILIRHQAVVYPPIGRWTCTLSWRFTVGPVTGFCVAMPMTQAAEESSRLPMTQIVGRGHRLPIMIPRGFRGHGKKVW